MLRGDLGEAGAKRDVLEEERDDVLERRMDGRHLDRDDLLQRHPSAELGLHLDEHVRITELLDCGVQRVARGRGAVPVDDEARGHRRLISAHHIAPRVQDATVNAGGA